MRRLGLFGRIVVAGAAALGGWAAETVPPTFAREVAPVFHRHCVGCHRPGGAGPFSLLDPDVASARVRAIGRAVVSQDMPPWLPAAGAVTFQDERRLTPAELELVRRWVEAGGPVGRREELPPAPVFPGTWQLGTPDLVVEFPEEYELGAEGPDEYRNVVISLPPGTNRFVRGFEFLPGHPAIHHARLLFDATGEARRRDAADPGCGFAGTMPPAKGPPGFLLGWTPGRVPRRQPPGWAFALDDLGDLVVQLHLRRTGKRERIRPRLGLFLTAERPTVRPVQVGLVAQDFEIPAGDARRVVSRTLELPVAAELLGVMPHAHYLGRSAELVATPPGGVPQRLLWIPQWRFHWQDEYRLASPHPLPKGTRLEMRITFDNSAGNPANPHRPPRTVRHGPESTDEMAEMWLVLGAAGEADRAELERAGREWGWRETVAAFTAKLQREPGRAGYHLELGKTLGSLGRRPEAFQHLVQAVQLDPELAEAHHYIGVLYYERGILDSAGAAFRNALELEPDRARTHAALGFLLLTEGDRAEAIGHLRRALALDPRDRTVRERLRQLGVPEK